MKKNMLKISKKFIKEMNIKRADANAAYDAIEKLGYTLINFNSSYNSKEVQSVIDALSLNELTGIARAFTYQDENYRLVFVNEDLNEHEKCIVLFHELGHIYMKHANQRLLIGNDVVEEYEANEFVHYIMNGGLIKGKKFYALTAAAAIIVVIIGVICSMNIAKSRDYSEFYVTETGSKYHRESCVHVKEKSDRRQITKEEYESGEYEPCNICNPDM